ncbi:sulfate transporter CysZ [Kaarinaea lacus]
MSNPITGIFCFIDGIRMIFKPGIRQYVAIPLLINILLFSAIIWFGINQFDSLLAWLMPELPEWLQFLEWLFWLLFAISALLILFFGFTLLANLVGAPFNGLLAEAVEYQVTGQRPETAGGWKKMVREIGPTMMDEIKKFIYMVTWSIPFLVLFIIPVVNVIAPFTWLAFSAWMLTVEYADYPMGNHGMRSVEQKQLLGKKRFLTLGFGGAVTVATMIPILNFLVMPAAVAGATLMWVKQLKDARETL